VIRDRLLDQQPRERNQTVGCPFGEYAGIHPSAATFGTAVASHIECVSTLMRIYSSLDRRRTTGDDLPTIASKTIFRLKAEATDSSSGTSARRTRWCATSTIRMRCAICRRCERWWPGIRAAPGQKRRVQRAGRRITGAAPPGPSSSPSS
jgi:hypothetical protein